MDRLSEAGRLEYLFARIMTRRDRQSPEVVQSWASEPAAASLVPEKGSAGTDIF